MTARRNRTTDDYTPRQRRQIDRELAKGMADLEAGRVYGPFSVDEARRFLRTELEARKGKATPRTSR